MKKLFLLILLALIASGLCGLLWQPAVVLAGTGEVVFVEAQVDLAADGSAVLAYTVQWRVTSGELHGFYFDEQDKLRIGTVSTESYAVDSEGRRYSLDINEVSPDRLDIVLADGQGVSSGTVTYFFWFTTSFAEAGYVAPTTSENGTDLVVFNWSPMVWDEAPDQDHYTLKVLTPCVLPAGVDPRSYVEQNGLVLTETFMNERYLIDYQRGEGDRLRLVFHKEDPGNSYHMQTQFYLPAGWFDLAAGGTPADGETWADRAGRVLPWAGELVLMAAYYFVVTAKHRSMATAHRGLDEVRWENLDWTPPKLILSNFRVPGKVCTDLTPLEAAFYLEIPFKQIVSAMIQSLAAEGYLKIIYATPVLHAKVLKPPDRSQLDPYECQLLESFQDDGELSQPELEALMDLAVANIQQKAWDCDIKATQEHYRGRIAEFQKDQRREAEEGRPAQEYDQWYWWYHNQHPFFTSRFAYGWNPWLYDTAVPVDTDHILKGPVRHRPGPQPERLPRCLSLGLPFGLPLRVPLRLPQRLPLRLRQRRLSLAW